jgi:hypothetical protein
MTGKLQVQWNFLETTNRRLSKQTKGLYKYFICQFDDAISLNNENSFG